MVKKKIAAVLLAAIFLSGCIPHTELDKRAIVEAMGIDYSEGKYEVTVQYFNMEGSGGSSPIDPSKSNVINISGKGESVSAALESASVKCGRNFMYGITSVIVIGKEALERDILKTLSFAESYYQSNPAVLIAAADKASDVIDVKFKEGVVSVERLEALLKNAEYHGMGETTKILELLSDQQKDNTGTVLPLLKAVNNDSDASDDGKSVELTGGVLINNRSYAGDLSLSDLSGIQLIGEKSENIDIAAYVNDERVSVTIYDVQTDFDYSFSEKGLSFDIDIHANGKYTDSQLKDKSTDFSEVIEEICEKEIKERIMSTVGNTVKKYGCDPFSLKYIITSENLTHWAAVENRFSDFLKNAEFDISCDVDIDRFGITH